MIIKLNHEYPSRYKVPIIKYVDDTIFTQHSFCSLNCMKDKCKDLCCYRGEDISESEIAKIIKYKKQLQPLLTIPLEQCFGLAFTNDEDYPSGSYTRTKVINNKCVFLKDKGCILHTIAISNGVDFHGIKPISGSLFPVSFNYGLLQPSHEITWNLDDCHTYGKTLYHSARNDLKYYFGDEFISELDTYEYH
jgi:Fe-S-cluster containining protein